VLRITDWDTRIRHILEEFGEWYGWGIAHKRDAVRYELLSGEETKNPRIRDIVRDWEQNHVAEWADEIDPTYQLVVYVRRSLLI
jgi:hypothetical protein